MIVSLVHACEALTPPTKNGASGLRIGFVTDPTRSPMKVLVYSDDSAIRRSVVMSLGSRPAPELPTIVVTEVATATIVRDEVAKGGIDVIILDGEAVPVGGMGVCKSLKEEIYQCPPILLLTGRKEDEWLARWSNADAVVQHPLDAIEVAHAVADLLRRRLVGTSDSPSAR